MPIFNGPPIRALLPIILTSGLLVVSTAIIRIFAFENIDTSSTGIDLRAEWQQCEGIALVPGHALVQECHLNQINLPAPVSSIFDWSLGRALILARKFTAPEDCLHASLRGCSFVIGGVFQGVELFVNGQTLGARFTRSDLHGVEYSIPSGLLISGDHGNSAILRLYTENPKNRPFVTQGPIGIVDSKRAMIILGGIISERMVLPILNAAVCVTMAIIAWFWMLSSTASPAVLRAYVFYCISATLYMINATRIPRELLGEITGTSLNFLLLYIKELGIYHLVCSYFSITSPWSRRLRKLYYFPILTCGALMLVNVRGNFFSDYFNSIHLLVGHLGGLRSGNLPYLVACVFTPCMLLGAWTGLRESWRSQGRHSEVKVLVALFLILLPMELSDAMTLLSFFRHDHEIYYLRLYPGFIALAFGYVIWIQWLRRESVVEATIKAGELATSVAHDLRSPLAVLNVLLKDAGALPSESAQLLRLAINRIQGTAEGLLSQYTSNTEGGAHFLSQLKCSRFSMAQLIGEIVSEKNHLLKKEHQLPIKLSISDDARSSPLRCFGDRNGLIRAFTNLINNALESSEKGGVAQVLVDVLNVNDGVIVDIIDNGAGFSASILQKIKRYEFGSSEKINGHGIGLAQVWRVIREHKGSVEFTNNSAGGARVRVTFPFEKFE